MSSPRSPSLLGRGPERKDYRAAGESTLKKKAARQVAVTYDHDLDGDQDNNDHLHSMTRRFRQQRSKCTLHLGGIIDLLIERFDAFLDFEFGRDRIKVGYKSQEKECQ